MARETGNTCSRRTPTRRALSLKQQGILAMLPTPSSELPDTVLEVSIDLGPSTPQGASLRETLAALRMTNFKPLRTTILTPVAMVRAPPPPSDIVRAKKFPA
jgi:hypothetical protein